MLKDRDYYLVERDGTISALRKPAAGGLEVELAVPPAVDKAVMDEPKQRVDLVLNWTKPDTLPVDLLVVAGIKSADETSPHVPHPRWPGSRQWPSRASSCGNQLLLWHAPVGWSRRRARTIRAVPWRRH